MKSGKKGIESTPDSTFCIATNRLRCPARPAIYSPERGLQPAGMFTACAELIYREGRFSERTMKAMDYQTESAGVSGGERRRMRRLRMIVDLTTNLIQSDKTLTIREGRCLVNCARKAILELIPGFDQQYEMFIAPRFERVLTQRWPGEYTMSDHSTHAYELVN